MQTPSLRSVQKQLFEITQHRSCDLRTEVAKAALTSGDVHQFFFDLLSNGCASGVVSTLVYYTDTHAFFDRYYQEIERTRDEWEASTGEALPIRGDLKNFLAWFAFEETAYRMAMELGLEI